MKISIYITLLVSLIFMGCDTHDHATTEQELPVISITQWTDNMELFMEHEAAITGHEIKFIIHLTMLADFQAVGDGKILLNFRTADGSETNIEKDELLRDGIFTPVHTFQLPGEYDFTLIYHGSEITESFTIGKFTVYPSVDDIPEVKDESNTGQITFLKEQQWKMDFATESAEKRMIKSGIHAIGQVKPQPASYAEIVSPVEGIISIAAAKQLVKPGQKVKKGQTLAVLVPPLAAQNSWAEIYLKYDRAKTEYERASRLQDRNAISGREYETAKHNYELNKAGFANYFGSEGGSMRFDPENQQFHIIAPISGFVSDVTILPGQNIDREQKLFSIVDPAVVWLCLELYADQAKKIDQISGASVTIPGYEDVIRLDESNMSPISRSQFIDPYKQTITIWLEVKNPNQQFIIGQSFSAQLYTGKDQEMLTVPLSAVYNDNTSKILFVHTAGETFEKRELRTGPTYHNHIGIMDGLRAGERVVSRGGYLVKLASSSEAIGHGHTH